MRFLFLVIFWTTTVVQAAIPVLNSSTPADNDTGVSQTADLVLSFSKKLTAVSGKNIKLYQSSGSLVESVDVTSAQVSITNGDKRVTVDFSNTLLGGTGYYINIDAGAFTNSGDPYAGISDSTTLNFTTLADTTAPSVTFNPANGATGVSASSNITLTFDESVRHTNDAAIDNSSVDALITLKDTNASGSDIAFDATISGNVITVNPSSDFSSEQSVYVAIGATVEDEADNALSATSATFTVADTTAPSITFSPLNGATGVANSANITLSFSESIRYLDNSSIKSNDVDNIITLKDTNASGSDIAFDATISGDVITINPDNNFSSEQVVYAAISASVEDNSDNAISAASTTFTAADSAAPTASLAYTVGGSSTSTVKAGDVLRITATFNEVIADSPTMQISGSGVSTLSATNMTKVSSTSYYYDWTVSNGTGTQAFALATGTDTAGNTITSTPTSGASISVDNTAPSLSSSTPTDNATGVAADANIILNFSEAVSVNTGNITLKKTTNDSTVETIDVAGVKVTGSGSSVITINPSSTLDSTTEYYVLIDSTAFVDGVGNGYAGISSSIALSFTTVDTVAPTVTTSPVNGATNVSGNVHIEFIFSEDVRHISDKTLANSGGQNFTDIDSLITLKENNASGADIAFSALVDEEVDGTIKIEVFPDSNLGSLQTVYTSLDATQIEDTSDNAIASSVSTTFTTTSITLPDYQTTYPRNLHKNIGIDANIVLDFNMVVYAPTNSAGGNNDRYIEIYNADTGARVFYELSNSAYISGSGTSQITIDPPNDLEERVNYYVLIGSNALREGDGSGNFFPGVSDTDTLTFMTAKDPNKYSDVVASNETGVNHSMNQVEKTISSVNNRQSFIRRNGGRNVSHQGIKFKFNNPQLDEVANKFAPLINHFNKYSLSNKLANAADEALPHGWGLWTSGEISVGNTNAENGLDRHSHSREVSIGLDKIIDPKRMAGISYRVNKTDTTIGSTGTRTDSSTKSWSLYGSIKNGVKAELEGIIGGGNISTDHTRIDGVNTYTGTRESQQVFACFIARENHQIQALDLSPFLRIDTSYTKQNAYTETGDSATAYDALHYKENKFHNAIISLGVDANTEFNVGNKNIRPYVSFRHKENTGYESNNVMYYTSNPIKEYTQNITANSDESGLNLVVGTDIQSKDGWLITASYELSESELTFNRGVRFRAEWKF